MTVLLSDEISRRVGEGFLITRETFESDCLKPASYDLRLDSEYFRNDKSDYLTEDDPYLVIGAHELVFVTALEMFHMPDDTAGRYDIAVALCHQGIGLQTGIQIDPGFNGKLFSPLFNFSDRDVTLRYMCPFASVEFYTTTKPTDKSLKLVSDYQGVVSLKRALPPGVHRSGLEALVALSDALLQKFAEHENEVKEAKKKVDDLAATVNHTMAFMIAALSVIVAVVSLVATQEVTVDKPEQIGMAVAAFAVVVGLGWFVHWRQRGRRAK